MFIKTLHQFMLSLIVITLFHQQALYAQTLDNGVPISSPTPGPAATAAATATAIPTGVTSAGGAGNEQANLTTDANGNVNQESLDLLELNNMKIAEAWASIRYLAPQSGAGATGAAAGGCTLDPESSPDAAEPGVTPPVPKSYYAFQQAQKSYQNAVRDLENDATAKQNQILTRPYDGCKSEQLNNIQRNLDLANLLRDKAIQLQARLEELAASLGNAKALADAEVVKRNDDIKKAKNNLIKKGVMLAVAAVALLLAGRKMVKSSNPFTQAAGWALIATGGALLIVAIITQTNGEKALKPAKKYAAMVCPNGGCYIDGYQYKFIPAPTPPPNCSLTPGPGNYQGSYAPIPANITNDASKALLESVLGPIEDRNGVYQQMPETRSDYYGRAQADALKAVNYLKALTCADVNTCELTKQVDRLTKQRNEVEASLAGGDGTYRGDQNGCVDPTPLPTAAAAGNPAVIDVSTNQTIPINQCLNLNGENISTNCGSCVGDLCNALQGTQPLTSESPQGAASFKSLVGRDLTILGPLAQNAQLQKLLSSSTPGLLQNLGARRILTNQLNANNLSIRDRLASGNKVKGASGSQNFGSRANAQLLNASALEKTITPAFVKSVLSGQRPQGNGAPIQGGAGAFQNSNNSSQNSATADDKNSDAQSAAQGIAGSGSENSGAMNSPGAERYLASGETPSDVPTDATLNTLLKDETSSKAEQEGSGPWGKSIGNKSDNIFEMITRTYIQHAYPVFLKKKD